MCILTAVLALLAEGDFEDRVKIADEDEDALPLPGPGGDGDDLTDAPPLA